jgi:histidine phosphotransferase ChpT
VDLTGEGDEIAMKIASQGTNARLANGVPELLAARPEGGRVDAHTIQPYFAGLVARQCGMEIEVATAPEAVTLLARPSARPAFSSAPEAAATV